MDDTQVSFFTGQHDNFYLNQRKRERSVSRTVVSHRVVVRKSEWANMEQGGYASSTSYRVAI